MSKGDDKPLLTNYLEVFLQKLDKQKKRIKNELDKHKDSRDREFLKKELKEAKRLKHLVKDMKKSSAKTCPHCGGELE
jgi:predicted  nucleic acid-binding Zn-ribbon protein